MPAGRVLMLAHHFPPAGGSGSNRALAFARYLPEYGWQPVVVTPGARWAINRDDGLLERLPPGVQVVRTRSLESRPPRRRAARVAPRAAEDHKPRSALRTHIGHLRRFPDAHVGWLPFALAAASSVRYDVAYSSSGPFTSHLLGLLLKRFTGRPWVAELRDGWYRWNRAIFPDYPAWRDRLERRLEAAALRSADRVVLVTERMAAAFRCQYADLPPEHFAVVPNGFDPLQFSPERPRTHAGWEVLHAGALYYGRSVAAFLEAAERLVEADPDFAAQFRLRLIGTLDAQAQAEVQRSRLGQRVLLQGQLEHSATLEAMRSADVLLLVANTTPGAEATVPGKLFEYLAVGRPVLAVAPKESATADVLSVTGGGWLVASGDPTAIGDVLRRAFRGDSFKVDARQVARFDRKRLGGELACVFDQVTGGAARRA